jgi:spore coat polysaccharide biosynthesis protein SpsF
VVFPPSGASETSKGMSKKQRIVAIIQARMGSTRLPGKVLKPVAGRPLLWHVIHRLKASKLIDDIAIATTTNPLDEAIVEFGAAHGVQVVRGPEEDVLVRFAMAAELLNADVIVRVSSDAPFVDAGFVDHLIVSMIGQKGDYVLIQEGAPCAHEGVDPFTRRGLLKLMKEARQDPVAREHVTGYFKLYPDFVPIARAAPYPLLAREAGRLTVDTPDDLVFVEALHERLKARAGEASLADLLLLLEREPDLRAINRHVKQKEIRSSKGLALIRCDGGGRFGYGHVKRMVALARALRDRESIGVVFALHGTNDAADSIRRAGFAVEIIEDHRVLTAVGDRLKPDLLLLDGREGASPAELEELRQKVAVTAVIDDAGDARLVCDFAYYPPVPQAHELEWGDARTVVRIGWEWALLGLNPLLVPARRPAITRPTLLVAMGGCDPQGLTLRAAKILMPLDADIRIRFVVGAGMRNASGIAQTIAAWKNNFETIEGADDLAIEYASADLALCAFGVTAYELAAFGVPALYLGLSEDHVRSASTFEAAGMGVSLGLAATAADADILTHVKALLDAPQRRREMRIAGLTTLDVGAAERIAAELSGALQVKKALRVA